MRNLALIGLALFFLNGEVFADGGFFYDPTEEVYQTNQYGIISYENGIEDLRILVRYDRGSSDFGWVMPLPAVPTVEEEDEEFFLEMSELSAPEYKERSLFGCGARPLGEKKDSTVEILGEGSVGALDYTIISAKSSSALITWLDDNHYKIPEQALPIFSDYIEKGWVFVAMRVDSLKGQSYGNIQPICFSFTSDEIVYPMRITSLNEKSFELLLHIIGDHRVTFEGFEKLDAEVEYANFLTQTEYEYIEEIYPILSKILSPGKFITRIHIHYKDPLEIKDDIFLIRAPEDKEFKKVEYSGLSLTAPFLFAFIFLRPRIKRRKRKKGI